MRGSAKGPTQLFSSSPKSKVKTGTDRRELTVLVMPSVVSASRGSGMLRWLLIFTCKYFQKRLVTESADHKDPPSVVWVDTTQGKDKTTLSSSAETLHLLP